MNPKTSSNQLPKAICLQANTWEIYMVFYTTPHMVPYWCLLNTYCCMQILPMEVLKDMNYPLWLSIYLRMIHCTKHRLCALLSLQRSSECRREPWISVEYNLSGHPCSLIIWSRYSPTKVVKGHVFLIGMKRANFISWSTITHNVSIWQWVGDRPMTKLEVIHSHFHSESNND